MWIEERKLANAIGPLILFFLLLGSWYAIALPIFEGADEISHFRVIEFIAAKKSLPHIIQDKEIVGHEAGQPPLYYAVLAPFIGPIDRSDFAEVVQENPHFFTSQQQCDLVSPSTDTRPVVWNKSSRCHRPLTLLANGGVYSLVYMVYGKNHTTRQSAGTPSPRGWIHCL